MRWRGECPLARPQARPRFHRLAGPVDRRHVPGTPESAWLHARFPPVGYPLASQPRRHAQLVYKRLQEPNPLGLPEAWCRLKRLVSQGEGGRRSSEELSQRTGPVVKAGLGRVTTSAGAPPTADDADALPAGGEDRIQSVYRGPSTRINARSCPISGPVAWRRSAQCGG